jgi:hypothetical protein
MINPTLLSQKLAGLVGFRQPYNPVYQVIDAANQASRSGYFITDNPFVKVESIKDSQDFKDISDADFNNFLRNKMATSTVNVANWVFNENDFIDRQVLYRHALNKFDQNSGVNAYDLPVGFSCYWIKPSIEKDIAFKITRVFLEFAGSGDITLHLFNTANLKTPLQSKTVSINNQPIVEVALDWTCDNSKSGAGYKGDYYLGYFTKDMTLKPYKREYREALVTAEVQELEILRSNFASFTQLTDNFDLIKLDPYMPYNGINPDITVYEDYTDLIIQNEKLFARAIQLDCQIALLSESAASIRSNRNERISTQYAAAIMTQIEGEKGENNVKVQGLRPQLYGAIASIRKELTKLQEGYTGQYQIGVQTLT